MVPYGKDTFRGSGLLSYLSLLALVMGTVFFLKRRQQRK
jgi:hypothetical protein